jgi:hypothetical protein
MNAKNDIDGYSSLHLCPLDLLKLKLLNPKMDFIQRYNSLMNIYLKLEWNDDAEIVDKRKNIIEKLQK